MLFFKIIHVCYCCILHLSSPACFLNSYQSSCVTYVVVVLFSIHLGDKIAVFVCKKVKLLSFYLFDFRNFAKLFLLDFLSRYVIAKLLLYSLLLGIFFWPSEVAGLLFVWCTLSYPSSLISRQDVIYVFCYFNIYL